MRKSSFRYQLANNREPRLYIIDVDPREPVSSSSRQIGAWNPFEYVGSRFVVWPGMQYLMS